MKTKVYQTTIYLGTTQDGKKHNKKVTAQTKKELDKKVQEVKRQIEEGYDLQLCDEFGHWAGLWLNNVEIPKGVSYRWAQTQQSYINMLNSEFEDVPFSKITLNRFQIFINALAAENPHTHRPTARKTLNDVTTTARRIAVYARGSGVAGVKEFYNAVIPRTAPKTKRNAVTLEQLNWILDTEHPAQVFSMLGCFAGLRRGEILPLKWKDIDFKSSVISIERSVSFINNSPKVKDGGKTANATRHIRVPAVLMDYLDEYRRRTTYQTPDCLIACRKDGSMHTERTYQTMWKSYMRTLNLKYGDFSNVKFKDGQEVPIKIDTFTHHQCRHFFATLCYLQGMSPLDAMQELGHGDIKTTVNTYTDLQHYTKWDLPQDFRQKLQTEYYINTTGMERKSAVAGVF